MNWKPQQTAFFWVPTPYIGQSRMDLVKWQWDKDANRQEIKLTNPDINQEYTAEIITCSDIYSMDQIPDWYARDCTNIPEMTGESFAALIRKHIAEFQQVKKVIFYQLNLKKQESANA